MTVEEEDEASHTRASRLERDTKYILPYTTGNDSSVKVQLLPTRNITFAAPLENMVSACEGAQSATATCGTLPLLDGRVSNSRRTQRASNLPIKVWSSVAC